MKLGRMLLFACIGWLAGALIMIFLAFVVSPAVMGRPHSIQDPLDRIVLGMALLGMTPGALAGGVVGGRMIHEGDGRSQLLMAALIGLVAAIPFGCFGFWLLGW
ncbi:hypothetical protein K2Z83_00950 [Oscillochloris sp. ZM17-4]|uniref:hypothetical protein n=1 Tax=Oscillochloris sp. ZM17-4 TaxID=2866714 RepID=UPI001C73DE9B|nr:hypothetical protein [Oscillochloris sp. ZM17-4]MBX0326261.1 hypothetical protein [Oscillochloris sp. ZM17-4]